MRSIFTGFSLIKTSAVCGLSLTLFGCFNGSDFRSDFERHPFDEAVINNWPRYDTLRQTILKHVDSFYLGHAKNDFTYIYNFDSASQISGHSNSDLPAVIYPEIVALFNNIGKENIFGFVLYRDSAFTVLVRNTHLTEYYLDVRERLYWYPESKQIDQVEFPVKDTILTPQWRYEIYYDKRAGF